MTEDFTRARADYARRLMAGDLTRSQYEHAMLMLERAEARAKIAAERAARRRETQARANARRTLKRQLLRSLGATA